MKEEHRRGRGGKERGNKPTRVPAVETDDAMLRRKMQGVNCGENLIGHLFPLAIGCGCPGVSSFRRSHPVFRPKLLISC